MKAFVISHTHWDREWYLTFEEYRIRLRELVKRVLNLLERDPEYRYFMLDGQSVLIEDIEEISPELHKKIIKYLREGRILAGPWYTLPDEFLITGESLIRNYIYGTELLKKHRIKPMEIAYLPDMFGHSAYIPTIVDGLSMKSAIIWRGVGDKSRDTEFLWEGPDGTKIFVELLIEGYFNMFRLPPDYKGFRKRVVDMVEKIKRASKTHNILLMNGTDHEFPYEPLSTYIKRFNSESKKVKLIHSNLPEFLKSVKHEAKDIKVVKGEFRSGKYEHILKDILSTRIYLKQKNREAEDLLTVYLEPLYAYIFANKRIYNPEHIEYFWKTILKNHAHDSIGGCGSDRMHQQVEERFNRVIDGIRGELGYCLAYVKDYQGKNMQLLVYNPSHTAKEAIIEKEIIMPIKFKGSIEIIKENGKKLPTEVITIGTTTAEEENGIHFERGSIEYFRHFYTAYTQHLEDIPTKKYRIVFKDTLKGFSFNQYYIKTNSNKDPFETKNLYFRNTIETEHMKVYINRDGTLTVLEKGSNHVYPILHYFEDEGDAGDEYNFSPPLMQQATYSSKGKDVLTKTIEEHMFYTEIKLSYDMRLPKSLTDRRRKRSPELVKNHLESTIRIFKNQPRIDFYTVYTNRSKDHRIRVCFDTGLYTKENLASDYFGYTKRKNYIKGNFKNWQERPSTTYPMQEHLLLSEKGKQFILISKGLPEYATNKIKSGIKVSLTLARAVGWLSRKDLKTRNGEAGPIIETPEAQCLRTFSFKYSIILSSNLSIPEIYRKVYNYLYPPISIIGTEGKLKGKESLFDLEGECIVSSIKVAIDKSGIIIRLFNPDNRKHRMRVRPLFNTIRAVTTNLAEKEIEEIKIKSYEVFVELQPCEIKSIKFSI